MVIKHLRIDQTGTHTSISGGRSSPLDSTRATATNSSSFCDEAENIHAFESTNLPLALIPSYVAYVANHVPLLKAKKFKDATSFYVIYASRANYHLLQFISE